MFGGSRGSGEARLPQGHRGRHYEGNTPSRGIHQTVLRTECPRCVALHALHTLNLTSVIVGKMAAAQFRSTLDGIIAQFASLWKDFNTAMLMQVVVVANEIADNNSKCFWTCF
jgi:hypothetical protein